MSIKHGYEFEQEERVAALRSAAEILSAGVAREYDTTDLISVAFWIATGFDPYDRRLLTEPSDSARWSAYLDAEESQ